MGLLETIYLQRITHPGQLAFPQQLRVARKQQLQQALDENALLAPVVCPPAPELHSAVASALNKARMLEQDNPQTFRLRAHAGWAAGVALLLGGLVLALLLLPHRAGWARMDGYVLRYPLVYAGYSNCTFYRYIPGPPKQLQDCVTAWALQHADAAPPGWQLGVAYVSGFNDSKTEPWVKTHQRLPLVYAAIQEVTLVNGDQALLDSLLEATRGIPHVGAPEVVSESWLYHSRLAQLFSKQDTLIISGKKYAFPRDFSPEDAELFGEQCGSLVPGQPYAVAWFRPDFEKRYGLGAVCRLERLDQNSVKIDALTREPVFADLEAPQGYAIGTPMDSGFTTEEIIRNLYQCAKQSALNKQQEYKELGGWGIVIPLLPRERIEGALNGALPARLSPEEAALTEARYAELKAGFDDWAQRNAEALAATRYRCAAMASPECIYTSRPGHKGSQNIKDYDRICLAFTAELRVEDPALRDSLLADLSTLKLVHPPLLWNLYPIKVPFDQLQKPGGAVSAK